MAAAEKLLAMQPMGELPGLSGADMACHVYNVHATDQLPG